MRTCPTPEVSANFTLAFCPQAFMCSRMRFRKSLFAPSMKETLNCTPLAGHLRPITTAMRRGATSTPDRRAFDRVPLGLVGWIDYQRFPLRVREQVELKTFRSADDD